MDSIYAASRTAMLAGWEGVAIGPKLAEKHATGFTEEEIAKASASQIPKQFQGAKHLGALQPNRFKRDIAE